MKINWFSPLPPAQTGIALYTAGLVPFLRKRAELVLWTDQQEWDTTLSEAAVVRRFDPLDPPWGEWNSADICFYNIGNNVSFHTAIWEMSRRHAGIVILHDLRLQHFFLGLYVNGRRDQDGYVKSMVRHYGERGRKAAQRYFGREWSAEQLGSVFPLTPLALEGALGAVVHNRMCVPEVVPERGLPVAYLPLPFAARNDVEAVGSQRRQRPPYRLVIFGVLGANRRLEPFLKAWAGIPERNAFRLTICGRILEELRIAHVIRDYELDDLVRIRGYVSDGELNEELTHADLAINLRYPTMGEASLSQLQIWEYCLPAVVTRVGWYAGLPEDTVAFVRPEREIEDIRGHLQAFLLDPARFAAMGRRGRCALEREHAPETYADSIIQLARLGRNWKLRAGRLAMARRAGADLRAWSTPPGGDALSQRLSKVIWDLTGGDGGLHQPD